MWIFRWLFIFPLVLPHTLDKTTLENMSDFSKCFWNRRGFAVSILSDAARNIRDKAGRFKSQKCSNMLAHTKTACCRRPLPRSLTHIRMPFFCGSFSWNATANRQVRQSRGDNEAICIFIVTAYVKKTVRKQKDVACAAANQLLFYCWVISQSRMHNYQSAYANCTQKMAF